MIEKKKYFLGEFLIKIGLINPTQLSDALDKSKKGKKRLGEVLVSEGVVSEEDIAIALGQQFQFRYFPLSKIRVEHEAITTISESNARFYNVIPISKRKNVITIAMADPLNVLTIDALNKLTGCKVEPVICTASDLNSAINEFYGSENKFGKGVTLEKGGYRTESIDIAAVNMVNSIIKQAVKDNASDIHIEPTKNNLRIRLRIDGVLCDAGTFLKENQSSIISRLKIMGDLETSKNRIIQEGSFKANVDKNSMNLRISTLPVLFGEKIVIKLISANDTGLDIDEIGLSKSDTSAINNMIGATSGLILVTGPKGSGKKTTLNSFIKQLNADNKNIVTIEKDIVHELDGVNQVQINMEPENSYVQTLKSILNQDPDIILIDELKDKETAKLAIEAALAGHLVLSTLDTENATSAITRLSEMSISPYLIRSSLLGVIGQRLVRKICPKCKESYNVKSLKIKNKNIDEKKLTQKGSKLSSGKGCKICRKTGYKGRTGIFEVLMIDEDIKELIKSGLSEQKILSAARKKKFTELKDSAIEKAASGITTVEEIINKAISG